MTRSKTSEQLFFDSEVEKTAKKLRKEARLRKLQEAESSTEEVEKFNEDFSSGSEEGVLSDERENSSEESEEETMAERTLRQLHAPQANQQPLCITYPNLEAGFELKSGLIHYLPKFHGMESENPHNHLKEFHAVCSGMRPQASRAAMIRREISGIKQKDIETLHDYWERFNRLCASCPQHGITDHSLIQYFYEGMLSMERKMVDAASGGSFIDKTPNAAKELIKSMAATSQQFGKPQETSRKAYEVSSSSIEEKLNALTSLVQNMALGKVAQVKACGICAGHGHATDECPSLQEENSEQINALNGYQGQFQRKYDPFSNTYNPGLRDHPNFSYKQQDNALQPNAFQQYHQKPQYNPALNNSNSGMVSNSNNQSVRADLMKFQDEQSKMNANFQANFQNLEKQLSQIATSLSVIQSQGKLPSQTEPNPRQNASAITLRNAKELTLPKAKSGHVLEQYVPEKSTIEGVVPEQQAEKSRDQNQPTPLVIKPPFSSRLAKSKKERDDKDIFETFHIYEPMAQRVFEVCREDKLQVVLEESFEVCSEEEESNVELGEDVKEIAMEMASLKQIPENFVDKSIVLTKQLEIQSLENGKVQKVNGHRLKPFYENVPIEAGEEMELQVPDVEH
ncbi:hypothetical protein M5689_000445 [Euphorbia peplus]|nr:hypothetical protein M5689_000445 [Euphorbia peplus]